MSQREDRGAGRVYNFSPDDNSDVSRAVLRLPGFPTGNSLELDGVGNTLSGTGGSAGESGGRAAGLVGCEHCLSQQRDVDEVSPAPTREVVFHRVRCEGHRWRTG